jgi:hypothetical protein
MLRSLGVPLGQGWMLGRPNALPRPAKRVPGQPMPPRAARRAGRPVAAPVSATSKHSATG